MDVTHLVVGSAQCPIATIMKIIGRDETIQGKWSTLASGLDISNARIKKIRQDILLDKISRSDAITDILELWIGQNGSRAIFDSLLVVVEDNCRSISVGELLRLEFNLRCRMSCDSSSLQWHDLSPSFQARVNSNVKKYFPYPGVDTVLSKLKGAMLVQLMVGEKPGIFNQTLPAQLNYYVKRTLITRNIISKKIFKHDSQDIFLFTGMDRYELSELAEDKLTSSSSEQIGAGRITSKFIILSQAHHFEKISNMTTTQPIHLLQKESDGKLRWVRSKGDMTTLQKFADLAQDELVEETFCKYLDSDKCVNLPVCIADSPGMGKSVLLAEIGRKLEMIHPERTVAFLLMSEFIEHIKQVGYKDKIKAIRKVLLNLICNCKLGKVVLNSTLDSALGAGVKVELLLDGFDEVNLTDPKLVYGVLQTITSSFKSIRLWVTSRPHLMQELECNLSVLGFNIRPFEKDDQVQFLVSFWTRKQKLKEEQLKHLASACLKLLQRNMKSSDYDLAGIPLQCLLIGEAFEEEVVQYAQNDSDSLAEFNIQINSITNLYRLLVEKKIKKYLDMNTGNKLSEMKLMNIHAQLSLELIFPDQLTCLKFLFNATDNIDKRYAEISNIGIMERNERSTNPGSAPRIIHRTVAEYFVAWFALNILAGKVRKGSGSLDRKKIGKWLSGKLTISRNQTNGKDCEEGLIDFLLQDVLQCQPIQVELNENINSHTFTNPVISYFFNSLLADHFQSAVPNSHAPVVLPNSIKVMTRLIHASAYSNFYQIFKFVSALRGFHIDTKTIFNRELLLLTIQKCNLDLIQLAFTYYEENHDDFDLNLQTDCLCLAVQRGNFSIVEFLIKEKTISHVLEELNGRTRTLLHDCIERSNKNSDWEIEQKIQLIRLLIRINPKLMEERPENGNVPLLSYHVHLRLMTELIQLGANIFAQDERKMNLLHLTFCRDHLSSENYHHLVKSIPETGLKRLVNAKGDSGRTPLGLLVEKFDPLPQTLEIFRNAKADFNLIDEKRGCSILTSGIESGRNATTLRTLIKCGASTSWRGSQGETLLHVAAAKGHLDAVGVFVEEKRITVNVVDEDGLTPLDFLIKSSNIYGSRFEVGKILHGRGGKFRNVVNSKGQSWLHVAVEEGNLQSVQLLVHLGINVNEVDKEGNAPLHMSGIKWNKLEFPIVKLLLGNDANPNAWNRNGETPFHLRLKTGKMEMDTFKLFKSKTNIHWTSTLATLGLRFVIEKGEEMDEDEFYSVIEEFEGHGADFNRLDSEGNSLLQLAIDSGHERAVRILLERKMANNVHSKLYPLKEANCFSSSGNCPSPKILKYLVQYGYAKDNFNQRLCDSHAVQSTQQKAKFLRIPKSMANT